MGAPQKDSTAIRGPILVAGPAASSLLPERHRLLLARLGQAARTMRLARGLSVKQLATECSIASSIVTAMEDGRADVGIAIWSTVEARLGVAPGWLVKASQWRFNS